MKTNNVIHPFESLACKNEFNENSIECIIDLSFDSNKFHCKIDAKVFFLWHKVAHNLQIDWLWTIDSPYVSS